VQTRQTPKNRREVRSIIVSILLVVLVAACGDSDDAADETTVPGDAGDLASGGLSVERHAGIDYTGTGSFNRMDVWAPTETGDWPAVIIVHGVADQSMSGFQPLAEAIASEGAVVYNIDVDSTIPWITAIEQVACAVRYARAHGVDFGGGPSEVLLLGNSTGAAVASVVALGGADFAGPCAAAGASAEVDAFVGYEGDYDYLRTADYFLADHRYLEDEDPELFASMDPYGHVGENTDLTVHLLHGQDEDAMWYEIPPAVSDEFCTTLEEAGYAAEMTVLEGSDHKDLMDPASAAFAEAVQATVALIGS
jgi:acetyl esterase/lipase